MGALRAEKAKELAEAYVMERATFTDAQGAEIDRTLLGEATDDEDDEADEGQDGTAGASDAVEGERGTEEGTE